MPYFLPAILPRLLLHASSSPLSADDLASWFIEQMEVSRAKLFSLYHQVFDILGSTPSPSSSHEN